MYDGHYVAPIDGPFINLTFSEDIYHSLDLGSNLGTKVSCAWTLGLI